MTQADMNTTAFQIPHENVRHASTKVRCHKPASPSKVSVGDRPAIGQRSVGVNIVLLEGPGRLRNFCSCSWLGRWPPLSRLPL